MQHALGISGGNTKVELFLTRALLLDMLMHTANQEESLGPA